MPETLISAPPYSALAEVYEEVMRGVPYAAWFSFIRQHWHDRGLLVDLFGGTGVMASIAAQHGLNAISLDLSSAMLRKSAGIRVKANALQLPLASGIASACTATNCSINYLSSLDELHSLFSECRRILKSGGLLVLDYCPIERAWALHQRRLEASGAAAFFHNYDAEQHLLTSQVTLQGENSAIVTEIHRQRIFSQEELAEKLEATGFCQVTFTPNYGLPVPVGVSPIMTLLARAQ